MHFKCFGIGRQLRLEVLHQVNDRHLSIALEPAVFTLGLIEDRHLAERRLWSATRRAKCMEKGQPRTLTKL